MALPKNFLWGGALAAHQFEGGVIGTSKGYSVADMMTAGAHFNDYDNPEEAMYICGHHTLVASAKAVIEGHKINPEFKLVI